MTCQECSLSLECLCMLTILSRSTLIQSKAPVSQLVNAELNRRVTVRIDEVSISGVDFEAFGGSIRNGCCFVKEKQKLSEDNIKEIEKNLEFTSKRSDEFEKVLAKEKESCEQEFSDVHKKILYLEAYSHQDLKALRNGHHTTRMRVGWRMQGHHWYISLQMF